jgi:predicted transcriptional regulator
MMSVMGEHSISQMPGGGPDGALVGLLEEVDLLNHLLDHEGFALLVVKDGRPVGILTKIDVLDYVAGKVESLDPKVLVNL